MKRIVSHNFDKASRYVRTSLFAKTVKMRNRRAIVSFSFDDFPRSAVLNGARLLEKNGVRGTFYLTGSYCGQIVDSIPQYHVEDLVSLEEKGHEIGCHTYTHPRVSMLSADELNEEINRNAQFAAGHLPGIQLKTFAYPFGDVSFAATMRLQSKFAGCRSSEPGLNIERADLGRLRSVRLYNRLMSNEDISNVIKEAVSSNAWLIFYTHDVAETPSNFGCTPLLFENAVKLAISTEAQVCPIDTAIKILDGSSPMDCQNHNIAHR